MKQNTLSDTIDIGNKTYHVSYTYQPEERDNEHFAPSKIEIEELFDEVGNEPDEPGLIELIEIELRKRLEL